MLTAVGLGEPGSLALDIESEDAINTAFGANLPRLNFFPANYNTKPASEPETAY